MIRDVAEALQPYSVKHRWAFLLCIQYTGTINKDYYTVYRDYTDYCPSHCADLHTGIFNAR